jgi:hypothetical protein
VTFYGPAPIAAIGGSFCLAWLIARKTVVEKFRGGNVFIRAYSDRLKRFFCLALLISSMTLFVNHYTGYFNIPMQGKLQPDVVPIVFFTFVVLLYGSFSYKQLEIDKLNQVIIYGHGILFTYSKQKIPFPEVTKILLISSYSYNKTQYHTLYLETVWDRKYLFQSRKLLETEKVTYYLKNHLELPVVHLNEYK